MHGAYKILLLTAAVVSVIANETLTIETSISTEI
jgi:hypothetical protein